FVERAVELAAHLRRGVLAPALHAQALAQGARDLAGRHARLHHIRRDHDLGGVAILERGPQNSRARSQDLGQLIARFAQRLGVGRGDATGNVLAEARGARLAGERAQLLLARARLRLGLAALQVLDLAQQTLDPLGQVVDARVEQARELVRLVLERAEAVEQVRARRRLDAPHAGR